MPKADERTLRFRRNLDWTLKAPRWPEGVTVRTLLPMEDPPAIYSMLAAIHPADAGTGGNFETWWQRLSNDTEFDPTLCFLAVDRRDRLLGVAQCWTSGFIKDLAVLSEVRGRGIEKACFGMFSMCFAAAGRAMWT